MRKIIIVLQMIILLIYGHSVDSQNLEEQYYDDSSKNRIFLSGFVIMDYPLLPDNKILQHSISTTGILVRYNNFQLGYLSFRESGTLSQDIYYNTSTWINESILNGKSNLISFGYVFRGKKKLQVVSNFIVGSTKFYQYQLNQIQNQTSSYIDYFILNSIRYSFREGKNESFKFKPEASIRIDMGIFPERYKVFQVMKNPLFFIGAGIEIGFRWKR